MMRLGSAAGAGAGEVSGAGPAGWRRCGAGGGIIGGGWELGNCGDGRLSVSSLLRNIRIIVLVNIISPVPAVWLCRLGTWL